MDCRDILSLLSIFSFSLPAPLYTIIQPGLNPSSHHPSHSLHTLTQSLHFIFHCLTWCILFPVFLSSCLIALFSSNISHPLFCILLKYIHLVNSALLFAWFSKIVSGWRTTVTGENVTNQQRLKKNLKCICWDSCSDCMHLLVVLVGQGRLY